MKEVIDEKSLQESSTVSKNEEDKFVKIVNMETKVRRTNKLDEDVKIVKGWVLMLFHFQRNIITLLR